MGQPTHRGHVQKLLPQNCPAYILAGGKSSRFGADKARVDLHGQPLLLQLMQEVTEAGHRVHVVADRADRYVDLGLSCLVDQAIDCGPLAGLAAALQHRSELHDHEQYGWLLLLSVDVIAWCDQWFLGLASAIAKPEYDASPRCFVEGERGASGAGMLQPLPSLWHIDSLPRVQSSLDRSQRSLKAFFDPELCPVLYTALCRASAVSPSALSFNDPRELAQKWQAWQATKR